MIFFRYYLILLADGYLANTLHIFVRFITCILQSKPYNRHVYTLHNSWYYIKLHSQHSGAHLQLAWVKGLYHNIFFCSSPQTCGSRRLENLDSTQLNNKYLYINGINTFLEQKIYLQCQNLAKCVIVQTILWTGAWYHRCYAAYESLD